MDALILVDVLDSHRNMISRQRLSLTCPGPPLVIGRDIACDIVVNDPYAAGRHAELSLHEDGTLRVSDLNTINGLILQGERIKGAMPVVPEDGHVQIGHSHLHIRTTTAPLAPEQPDLESLRSKRREYGVLFAGAVLCAGFGAFTAWIGSPDNEPVAIATNLLFGTLVLAVWLTFWVVLGRSLRSRWQWSRNGAIMLGGAATYLWLNWAAEVATFITGVSLVERLGPGLAALIAVVAIYLHLRVASRLSRQRSAVVACVIPLLGVTGYLWFVSQQYAEDVNQISPPGHLYPPSWSQQRGMRLDKFFDEALELRDMAEQKRAEGALTGSAATDPNPR